MNQAPAMWSWVCRGCAQEFESPIWRSCPRCQSVRVWCVEGQWCQDGRPWSQVPEDVLRQLQRRGGETE